MKRAVLTVFALSVLLGAHSLLLRASVILVPSGMWASTGDLAQPRAGSAAVLLSDGVVLVTGGIDAGVVTSSTERYSAAGGTFVAAAPMQTPRTGHSATRLTDGRVLVAGGIDADGSSLSSAEIYNPHANAWLPGGTLVNAREGHTATLLADGRVLVAGGESGSTAIATLEVFSPVTEEFALVAAPMSTARTRHAATVADGKVMIIGGWDGTTALSSVDIYDPETNGVFGGAAMISPRADHSATTLLNGNVLVAGGTAADTDLRTAELFDVDARQFVATASLSAPRRNHFAVLLPHNNSVLVAGGSSAATAATAELYRSWQDGGIFVATGSLLNARNWSTATALSFAASASNRGGPADGLLLAAGGDAIASAEVYGFATVKTDKDDYAPGMTVRVSGSGWQPGQPVTFYLRELPSEHYARFFTIEADGSGNIDWTDLFLVEEHHLGVRFLLTAADGVSQAHLTFTDGNFRFLSNGPTLSGISFQLYSNASCTVPVAGSSGSGTITTADDPLGTLQIAAVANRWIGLTVPASAGGQNFANWVGTSGTPTFTTSGPGLRTICVAGDNSNGLRRLTANYAAPANTPPTIAADTANVIVSEGQTANNTGTWSDVNAGNTVTLSASIGTVVKGGTNAAGTWSWSFATNDGPANGQTVTITANDGQGGTTSATFALGVNNAPPTAVFNAPPSVNEGSAINLSLSGAADPSSADTAIGFTYAFDCGAGYGAYAATSSTTCATTDDGSRIVKGKIRDKDAGETEYTATVMVTDVPPTIGLTGDASANEGSEYSLTLGTVVDSGDDTVTSYTIHWGDGVSTPFVGSPNGLVKTHTYEDGPNTHTITVDLADEDGTHAAAGSKGLTINNVVPTATFVAPSPVLEGSAINLSLTAAADPSSVDTAAGFTYAFDCGTGTGYGAFGASSTATCPTTDNGTRSVKAKIRDKDDGASEYSATITIDNVAPTATFAAGSPVNEGTAIALSLSSPFDPSSADTAAGFTYAFDCGTGYGSYSPAGTASCPTTDDGSRTVKGKIRDKDNGETEYTAAVTIVNVAPAIPLTGAASVNEGLVYSLTLGTVVDPGDDTVTSYAVNWGDGASESFAGSPNGSVKTHTYADGPNGYTITVDLVDEDGTHAAAGTRSVTIVNVAPSATLGNGGPVFEGSAVVITFTGPSDPSAVDTAAGFKYSFNCDNVPAALAGTYAAAGASASANCIFGDNGPRTIVARVFDKDNGYTEHTTLVTVNNAAPSTAGTSFSFNPYTGAASAGAGFSDAGWLDTVSSAFSWAGVAQGGSPASFGPGSAPALSGAFTSSHIFGAGCITQPINVVVSDDDGGAFSHQFAAANTLGLYSVAFLAPLKDGARNVVKLGNVIPVKLTIRDCGGSHILNKTLSIYVTAGVLNMEDVTGDTELIPATSVSGADVGGVMRVADSHYMYNLATKGLATGLPYTIVIKDGPLVVATAVIETKK